MQDETMLRPPQEQEVFRRVWQRVMAGRDMDSVPIETSDRAASQWVGGDLSCGQSSALCRPVPVCADDTDRPVSDLTPEVLEETIPRDAAQRLRQQTLEALEAWQFYRYLARRTRGGAARTLAALAADQHQQARRLSTAYFLHSGVRYWPSEQLPAPVITSYWGALRQRHQAEQQAELSYRMAADETQDAALTDLYGGLTEACRAHCRQLRALLEQSCP